MGGRATFFVDSLGSRKPARPDSPLPFEGADGIVSRLDKLVEFRDPLGPAAKEFLPKLKAAFLVETGAVAERLARENPQHHFVAPDGTCYHGRMVTGGRAGDSGPLALKRELRVQDAEATRLERAASQVQAELGRLDEETRVAQGELERINQEHLEAEKGLVAATHQREQARDELAHLQEKLAYCRDEIEHLRREADAARERAAHARRKHAEALRSRAETEAEAERAAGQLAAARQAILVRQEEVAAKREESAATAERLASAEMLETRLAEELEQARRRFAALREQQAGLAGEKAELELSSAEQSRQAESFRAEKARLEESKSRLEQEWEEARTHATGLDDVLRGKRQSLDELRAGRGQHEVEKARNDADRDYLRQTCTSEVNAQPEELIAQQAQLLSSEELAAAEANYAEMKSRVESMGPVNMMALEEYQECEQREAFLSRERDDLVESIQNTQQAIAELDQVSRQKFDEAFAVINVNFADAFRTLFGGGTGEMRLTEPDSSGESGIDIVAQPPGKRLQNVLLLSGGEKALTALALLIAIFRYQPSPFCILDEVDAPLDEANVGRFNKLLAEMGGQTQFIVVTHNRRTMEMGSVLYGVTMQEPGVSKIVSVRWDEAASQAQTNAA
jgi:chromosome segregation protein